MGGWRPHLPRGSANFTPRFSPIVRIYPEELPVLPRGSASFTPNRASIVRFYPEDLPVLPRTCTHILRRDTWSASCGRSGATWRDVAMTVGRVFWTASPRGNRSKGRPLGGWKPKNSLSSPHGAHAREPWHFIERRVLRPVLPRASAGFTPRPLIVYESL